MFLVPPYIFEFKHKFLYFISYCILLFFIVSVKINTIKKKKQTRLLIYSNTHCANAPNERISADQDQVFP